MAKEHQITPIYDWQDLIQEDAIDVVSIVSPVFQHRDMVLDAISLGKDILAEKPMAMNRFDAYTMWQALEDEKLVGMINHEFRYIAARHYFHNLIQEGRIGRIYEFDIELSMNSRVLSQKRAYSWWSNILQGGGAWGALGSHLVDFVQWTFDKIETIQGQLQTNVTHRQDPATGKTRLVTADDTYRALVTLKNGTQGLIHGGVARHGTFNVEFIAYGENGALMMRDDAAVLFTENKEDWHLLTIPDEVTLRPRINAETRLKPAFEALLDDFARGLQTRTSPTPSFEDGYFTQLALDGLHIASETKSVVNLDDLHYETQV